MTEPSPKVFQDAGVILDAEPVPRRSLAELRVIALAHGAWACPACPEGFELEQYLINTDTHVCVVCGYSA